MVGERAKNHAKAERLLDNIEAEVRGRVQRLIDDWAELAHEARQSGVVFGYAIRDFGRVNAIVEGDY